MSNGNLTLVIHQYRFKDMNARYSVNTFMEDDTFMEDASLFIRIELNKKLN